MYGRYILGRIKNGKCGIDLIQKFDTTDFKVKVGAEVKDFDPNCI